VSTPFIQVEELKRRLDAGENLLLLDVREEYEYEISNIGGRLIPLAELPKRINELDASKEIVTLCKLGSRSAQAVELLRKAGFQRVSNLNGGIRAWSERVDSQVPRY
jgi:sulfur-carrier protein adenylyltransferase/sulfurtransferase